MSHVLNENIPPSEIFGFYFYSIVIKCTLNVNLYTYFIVHNEILPGPNACHDVNGRNIAKKKKGEKIK